MLLSFSIVCLYFLRVHFCFIAVFNTCSFTFQDIHLKNGKDVSRISNHHSVFLGGEQRQRSVCDILAEILATPKCKSCNIHALCCTITSSFMGSDEQASPNQASTMSPTGISDLSVSIWLKINQQKQCQHTKCSASLINIDVLLVNVLYANVS